MILNTPARDQGTQASIWLLLQVSGQWKVFEFVPGNDRCVVIGSAGGADVPLEGLAPIALYLQRDGTGIRLIPAHAETGCRVNAQLVRGPCVIQYQALIELSGYQIALYISEACPNFAGHVPAAPQSGTTAHSSAPGSQTSFEPRARASKECGDPAINAAPSRSQARTFVLGCHSPNLADPVAPRKVNPSDAATAVPPNSIEPTPILALGSDPVCCPRSLGTQALSPSELAAIRAMAPARQPLPPQRLEQPMPSCPEPFDQTRHRASSMPVAKVMEACPAADSELPKVIPFEPMRVAAAQVQGASSSGHANCHSTVVDVKALSPLALAAQQRVGVLGVHGHASNRPSEGQRSSGHAHAPRPMDMQRADALAAQTSSPPAFGSSRLGVLAQRHLLVLIGAVIMGILMLIALLMGTARLHQPATPTRAARNAATAPLDRLAAAAVVSSLGAAPPNQVLVPPTTEAVPVLPVPGAASVSPKGSVVANVPDAHASARGKTAPAAKLAAAASAEELTLPNAAGHLFASRLPEAEQAYRELVANNPGEPIFSTVVRLLGKRNSPECRSPTNNTRKSCPTVKP